MPDTVGLGQHKQPSLRGIATKALNKPNHRFRDLYRMLTPTLLWHAWIKLNKSSAIADDDLTVEEYDHDLFGNLAALIVAERRSLLRSMQLIRRQDLQFD